MLNNILRALAPLLFSASLMLIWVILILGLVVLWLVKKFRDGRVTTGLAALLALIILPLSSWLLGRSFFRAGIFAGVESGGLAAISENIGSVLENSGKPADPEEPSGGASDGPVSSSAPNVPTDPGARKPEDFTDEEMLALAEESFDDMFSMGLDLKNTSLLPTDFSDSISIPSEDPANNPWPRNYVRVVGYTTLEEAGAALEEIWYSKHARKYPVDLLFGYVEANDGLYALEPAMGGPGLPLVIDGITRRNGDEVVFVGHWDSDGHIHGFMEFSLVYEDNTWKYGYCESV